MAERAKIGRIELKMETVDEAKNFCAALELAHGKLKYHRVDDLLWVHVNLRKIYLIKITNWMNGALNGHAGGNYAVSKNRFLGTQSEYNGTSGRGIGRK